MEYTVFDRGAAVGSASAERRGLYWHIAAECRMETDRIVRLYAHDGEKRVRLGVLMPEGGALRLERRLAADAFSFTPQTRITTSPDAKPAAPERPAEKEAAEAAAEPEQTAWAAWEPFSGRILDCPVENARLRRTEDGAELDMDYEPGREFPLMPLFCFCTLEELDGALRWRMKLDENMQPVMPEEKKPLTTG